MKKILCSIIVCTAALASACWFTDSNYNGNYIAGVNNFVSHYTPATTFSQALYHNGGTVSLPLTVYVKLSPRLPDQEGETEDSKPIVKAILQYKVYRNGLWSTWTTVKSFDNPKWDLSYSRAVPLFGRENIYPQGLTGGDQIMVRLYLTDGPYETGDLNIDPGDIPDTATAASGGTYAGGWSAPFVFRVTFSGKYWR